jgi:hypothetical protein
MDKIQSYVDRLQEGAGRWVVNAPSSSLEARLISYKFTSEQFALGQSIVSGAELGPAAEDSIAFLEARESRLHGEAQGNAEEYGVYQLGSNYCSSGWFVDGEGVLFLWYETTSGTVLVHAIGSSEEVFEILLPEHREMGCHHTVLARIAAGMTSDQYHRWYSNYLDEKGADYAEEVEFHNAHLVPLGWEPMESLEERTTRRSTERETKKALIAVERDADQEEDWEDYDGLDEDYDYGDED